MRYRAWIECAFLLAAMGSSSLARAAPGHPAANDTRSPYADARAKFWTRLVRRGPAPQLYPQEAVPPDVQEIAYASGGLTLKAWVSAPPPDGKRHAAVLYLHGGFAFSRDDWEQSKPYRDAGYVVLTPMLRGENGLPGAFSMFFDELDDVLAAADALARIPYVQGDDLYVAGHSVGGTYAMLAAMASSRFRAAASFSGSPDQVKWTARLRDLVPFDPDDQGELKIRSPVAWASSFRCPLRAYHGDAEAFFVAPTARLAKLAQAAGRDVRAVSVPGNHLSHVPEAIRQSIEFFRASDCCLTSTGP